MTIDLWSLPGPRRWMDQIMDERDRGGSGVVIAPNPHEPHQLLEAFETRQPLRGARYLEIPSSDHGAVEDPSDPAAPVRLGAVLAEQLDLAYDGSISAVAASDQLGRSGVVVDARTESPAVQSVWMALAREFQETARSIPHWDRPTLWVLVAPVAGELRDIPDPDVEFQSHWFWGVVRPLDVLVAADELRMDSDLAEAALEVVRWDIDLLERLRGWNGSTDGTRSFGLVEPSAAVPEEIDRRTSKQPPADYVAAWADRLVDFWGGRVARHLCADLHDDRNVRSRIWAGQVSGVMSFIEKERELHANWLSAEIDRNGYRAAGYEETDVAHLEIGQLHRCARQHRHRTNISEKRLDLLRDLTSIRNRIAHREPVGLSELRGLRQRAAAYHEGARGGL